MILQYSEILDYHWLSKAKQQSTAHWQQWFYNPCLASAMKKYTTMTNYNDQDDKGYDDGNKDINYDNTFASRSGSDGPIFDPIAMPWSRRGESGDRRRRYDCGALYI